MASESPPTQATWRQLIRLLLAYKGVSPDLDDVRAYQRDHWGHETGETCVIELSGIPARDRLRFLSLRVDRIRQQMREHPVAVRGSGRRERGGAIFPSGEVAASLLVLTSLPNDLSAKEVGNLSVTHVLLLSPNSL